MVFAMKMKTGCLGGILREGSANGIRMTIDGHTEIKTSFKLPTEKRNQWGTISQQ